jgi:uncharacterized protein YkwD
MRAKHLFDKRVAAILMTAFVALGVSSCAAPASSPPGAPGTSAPSDVSGIVNAMNQDRAANGLGGLSYNDQLAGSGAGWSSNIASAGSLFHQDLAALLGQPAWAGFRTLGENLLVGPDGMSASQMETAWMNSPGHRANILNGSFTLVGIGITHSGGRVWVAVEFGG